MDEVYREGTLWYDMAKEHYLLEDFANGFSNNSSYQIDFSKDLPKCAKEFYLESLAIHQTANIIKTQANV